MKSYKKYLNEVNFHPNVDITEQDVKVLDSLLSNWEAMDNMKSEERDVLYKILAYLKLVLKENK